MFKLFIGTHWPKTAPLIIGTSDSLNAEDNHSVCMTVDENESFQIVAAIGTTQLRNWLTK